MKLPHLIATATTAAVLGTAGVSLAGATSEHESLPAAETTATAATDAAGDQTHQREGRAGNRRHRIGKALEVAADAIGVERADLVKELRDGKTIADVATAHNVDPQTVVDALVQAGQERIVAAVAAGKLDAERAAELEAHLAARAEKLVNNTHTKEERQARRKATRERRRAGLDLAAETIGVERADLVKELRDGKTIADVATAHNVDPQTVVDALVAAATKNIDAARAAGKLTDEQAEKLTARAPERIARLVDEGRRHSERPATNG